MVRFLFLDMDDTILDFHRSEREAISLTLKHSLICTRASLLFVNFTWQLCVITISLAQMKCSTLKIIVTFRIFFPMLLLVRVLLKISSTGSLQVDLEFR